MARPPKKWSHEAEVLYRTRMRQGWTAEAIAAELKAAGFDISRSTVGARMKNERGSVATPRARGRPAVAREVSSSVTTPPEASESQELPTEADIEAAERGGPLALANLLDRLNSAGRRAEAEGNLTVMGRMASLELAAQSLMAKLAPAARPDPNDSPDMIKLGAEVEARFLKMIDLVLEQR